MQNDDDPKLSTSMHELFYSHGIRGFRTRGFANFILPGFRIEGKSQRKIFINFRWDHGSKVIQVQPQLGMESVEDALAPSSGLELAQWPVFYSGVAELVSDETPGVFQTYSTLTSTNNTGYVVVWCLSSGHFIEDLSSVNPDEAIHILAIPVPLVQFMTDIMLAVIEEMATPPLSSSEVKKFASDSPEMNSLIESLLNGKPGDPNE